MHFGLIQPYCENYRMFRNYCPIPLFAFLIVLLRYPISIGLKLINPIKTRENLREKSYCTRVHNTGKNTLTSRNIFRSHCMYGQKGYSLSYELFSGTKLILVEITRWITTFRSNLAAEFLS